MGHWEYRYDAAGNLVKQRDARGQALCFYYDALNRLVGKTYHSGVVDLDGLACPGGPYAVSYTYDQGVNGIGRRTGMTDTVGVTTWQYDARGRVLTETRTLSGIGIFVTAWGYDAADRVVRMVYPDGEVVNLTYDRQGLLASVVGQDAYLMGATYNALGRPLQQTWGNGRITTYAYHPQNFRLTRLQVSGNLLDLQYGYDRVGNIIAITDTVNSGQVQTFGYDARDRLIWARTNGVGNGQYDEAYGYDRMGNIITRTVGGAPQSYTYGCPPPSIALSPSPALPYQVYFPLVMRGYGPGSPPPAACVAPFAVVSTTAGFQAAYDPNGNMVLRVEDGVTYQQEFDAENRLVVVTNTVTGQVTRFVYDGDGNRILRIGPEGTTVYIGDYYEREGSTVRKYYYAGGQRIAVRVDGILYFLHTDHLGSATLATDVSGNRVGEVRYKPYGEVRQGYPVGVMPTDRLYTGQRWESALGLYDYRARYYHPVLGRFISADPVVPEPGNPQALNRYAYVFGNPLRHADSTGHYGEEVHYKLTYEIVYESIKTELINRGYHQQIADSMARNIAYRVAKADQEVDEVPLYSPDSSIMANSPHWWSHAEASNQIQKAGMSPEAFGRALHGAQDYYSHEGLGYTGDSIGPLPVTWGHVEPHTLIAKEVERRWGINISQHPEFDEKFRQVNREWAEYGLVPTGLDPKNCPDYYDPMDPWDQHMVSDTRMYVNNFARLWVTWWESGHPYHRSRFK